MFRDRCTLSESLGGGRDSACSANNGGRFYLNYVFILNPFYIFTENVEYSLMIFGSNDVKKFSENVIWGNSITMF